MTNQATWTCACGAVEAQLTPVEGTRCICYCASCQAFLRRLDKYDLADAHGGTDLFQTTPDKITFSKGLENLTAMRITDKGPIRWSTTCCNTPVCNTGAKRVVPLASFLVAGLQNPKVLPPVLARVNRKDATGRVEGEAGSMRSLIFAFLRRAIPMLITGKYKRTPFFNADGRPVAEVKLLSPEEKLAAYGG